MKKSTFFIVPVFVCILLMGMMSCSTNPPFTISYDTIEGEIIADTITYDVVIKNPNEYDEWTEKCLQHLDRKEFIDQIFEALYDNRMTAKDYFSNEKISHRQLKRMEKEQFTRESIGKIQFTEVWYYDSKTLVMKKRVISMIFGYENYSETGEFRDYKPAFKVYLN